MIFKSSLVILLAAGAFGFPAVGKEYSNSSHPTSSCVKCDLPEPPVEPPCPTGDAGQNRFGLSGEQTATFAENGPIATLSPNVHWSCDTAPASNVIPIPANEGSQMYYGVGVNLDHCDHVASMEYTAGALIIVFASEEAYRHAVDTWATDGDGGLILLAFIKGCGDYLKGERCYFVVSELDFGPPGYVVRANGKARHPDEIATSGSATWGHWSPRKGEPGIQRTGSGSGSGSGPAFTWSPQPTVSPGSGSGPGQQPGSNTPGASAAAPPAPSPSGITTANLSTTRSCAGPLDTKYGLPTACLGEFFDEDLDDSLGYTDLSQDDHRYILGYAPDFPNESLPPAFDFDVDAEGFFKKRHNQLRKRQAGLIKAAADIAKKAYQTVQFATALSGTINREFIWKLPDPSSGNADAKKVQDREAKQMRSPWGDAILLRRFSNSARGNGGSANGFMDVYCVGCGVTGNAKVAGSAKWTPGEGIVEGQVEIRTDVMFVLKVGIDAGIVLKQNFKAELFSLGLPGLSFGVVSIGPRITVATSVVLQAAATGRLLAGAQMGLEDARIVLDLVNESKAPKGWEPYFKPVFEANGSLMVSSTLSLPIGIKCGIKVGTFSKDVGVISEPSIKGVAQVAASIGNSAGVLEGGFTSRDGCPGIAGQISYRHKLYAEFPGRKQPLPLLDTLDKPVSRFCLPCNNFANSKGVNNKGVNNKDVNSKDVNSKGLNISPPVPTDPVSSVLEPVTSAVDPPAPTVDSPAPTVETAAPVVDTAAPVPPTESSVDPIVPPADSSSQTIAPTPDATSIVLQPTGGVVDETPNVAGSTELGYAPQPVGTRPYTDDTGRKFGIITDSSNSSMIISCSNGNMYPVRINSPENEVCSELWAAAQNVLIYDGAERLMHYYTNTMLVLGVSRLRVGPEFVAPAGAAVVTWAVYTAPDGANGSYYVAVDSHDGLFYPIVCDYSDGTASRLFLAKDPVAGVTLLESADVMYSVTGGQVSTCQTVALGLKTRQG
ncbi:hypothetical protein CkaCkLH20_10321 [Colletotrichum karsti]|uniref:DUF7029 domain-containing protein n=1 Tax=Colletotrichum karsti TaxID=1095194 RepID=A0A9P6HXI6_9PEZI|nr:uncharacterized protein CkaCkLH20_10321 [Colletotrichum karsti]KAF9872229.1 hypothetical protein CkaCkLH20_10321 [Colletotrichum karsti]